jgi:hypothetical protein
MTVAEKRKQMVDFLEKEADDKLVSMVYALVQEYTYDSGVHYELSDEQFEALEKAREIYKSGKAKTYTLEEVNNMLSGKTE